MRAVVQVAVKGALLLGVEVRGLRHLVQDGAVVLLDKLLARDYSSSIPAPWTSRSDYQATESSDRRNVPGLF